MAKEPKPNKARKAPRKRKGAGANPAPGPVPAPSPNGRPRPVEWEGEGAPSGRVASSIKQRRTTWFLKPWIPNAKLTFVVGLPTTGKSTFLAWLMSQASRCAILPGYEEEADEMLLPRLEAAGADPEKVLVMDDKHYLLQENQQAIIDAILSWGAELLVIDPIDDYLPSGFNENDSEQVRSVLRTTQAIAVKTGAAVVCVRYPGKATQNVMPGNRQWRHVPKAIVELLHDPGPPSKRVIRSFKDSHGQQIIPHSYELLGEKGEPKRFVMGGPLSAGAVDACKAATDARERIKAKEAQALIRQLLHHGEQESAWVLGMGRSAGLGETTMYDARNALGVDTRREGFGRESKCFWKPPKIWPETPPEGTETAVPVAE